MASAGSHESKVILNTTLLSGIQNISFTQNVAESRISTLGVVYNTNAVTAPTSTTARIDKVLLNNDIILQLTGTKISGQFIYGDNILDFTSGVIDGFSVEATIGAVPQIAFDMTIYGILTGTTTSRLSTAKSDASISPVRETGIFLFYDKSAENAVQSFSFSETYNWEPMYKIGSDFPSSIVFKGPIQQSAVVDIEVENYTPESNYSFIRTQQNRNRSISLSVTNETGHSKTFALSNAYLVSESLSNGVGGSVVANLTYNGTKTANLDTL